MLMRQGQQHRRGRGRSNNNNNNNSNNNRRGQNPNARSFESTGPDVKIRGTATHITEKYLTLARDAQSSGDPVLAENYFQHAEHYHRIIMAYREQQMLQNVETVNGGMNRQRNGFGNESQEGAGDFSDFEGDDPSGGDYGSQTRVPEQQHGFQQPLPQQRTQETQPRSDETHSPIPRDQPRPGRDRFNDNRGFGRERDRDRDRSRDRRPDAGRSEVGHAAEPSAGRPDNGVRRRNDRFAPPPSTEEQPEFLRRPVRRPRRDAEAVNGGAEPETEQLQPDPRDKTSL